MPNIKSAVKRVSVTANKKLSNQIVKSQMLTALRKFNAAIATNDLALAQQLMPITTAVIDTAAVKDVISCNARNHKKAQIAKALDQLSKGIIVVKSDVKTLKIAEQKAAGKKKVEDEIAAKAQRKLAKEAKAQAVIDAAAAAKKSKKAPKAKPTV